MALSEFDYVIVGGGIAGVTCCQTLCELSISSSVCIISASPLLKVVSNLVKITRRLESFNIEEQQADSLTAKYPNLSFIQDVATKLDHEKKTITLESGSLVGYRKSIVLCCGAIPAKITGNDVIASRNIVAIRDVETVDELSRRLAGAKQICIIGNGGIATELAHKVSHCRIIWSLHQGSIGATFFDAGAAKFFLDSVAKPNEEEVKREDDENGAHVFCKRLRYTHSDAGTKSNTTVTGSALGPDWTNQRPLTGNAQCSREFIMEYETEVEEISSKRPTEFTEPGTWPMYVRLSNGRVYGCDFVVSATGVVPNVQPFAKDAQLALGVDGGIRVDGNFETSVSGVFAVGDCCSMAPPLTSSTPDEPSLWFQMRLWTQARHMGEVAAIKMHDLNGLSPDYFHNFTHVTTFFDFKVILLGLYNGQTLSNDDYDALIRITPGVEYVKALICRDTGRMLGAILVGETDLEEIFENLLHSCLDLRPFGEHLLEPGVDLEDFFD